MKRKLFHVIANSRKNTLTKKISELCWSFIKAYENWNNDHHTNGEFNVLEKLSRFNPEVIFDVGANVGQWSTFAYNTCKNATIYAMEPIPEIYNTVKENCAHMGRIKPQNIGLSSETKSINFHYFPKGNLFNSMFDIPNEGEQKLIACQVINGDEFCKQINVDHIDFMKIDVEGAEHLVLEGMNSMLMNAKIKAIQFEYGRNNVYTKFILKDFYELLQKHGFIIGKIYPNYVEFSDYKISKENFMESNYLAIHLSQQEWITALRD